MPKFEVNMNYIHPSPPSSMKQCNKSATVKLYMELLFDTTCKQSCIDTTPIVLTGHGVRRLDLSNMTHHRPLVRGNNITR